MHQKASSSVKWDNKISQQFPVTQGVRQGGILSSDLYKVYKFKGDDPLLNLRCIGFWIASILWLVRFFYYGFNYFIDDW
jgi:hypothetical protein